MFIPVVLEPNAKVFMFKFWLFLMWIISVGFVIKAGWILFTLAIEFAIPKPVPQITIAKLFLLFKIASPAKIP